MQSFRVFLFSQCNITLCAIDGTYSLGRFFFWTREECGRYVARSVRANGQRQRQRVSKSRNRAVCLGWSAGRVVSVKGKYRPASPVVGVRIQMWTAEKLSVGSSEIRSVGLVSDCVKKNLLVYQFIYSDLRLILNFWCSFVRVSQTSVR